MMKAHVFTLNKLNDKDGATRRVVIQSLSKCVPFMKNAEFVRAFRGLSYIRTDLSEGTGPLRSSLIRAILTHVSNNMESMSPDEVASLMHS